MKFKLQSITNTANEILDASTLLRMHELLHMQIYDRAPINVDGYIVRIFKLFYLENDIPIANDYAVSITNLNIDEDAIILYKSTNKMDCIVVCSDLVKCYIDNIDNDDTLVLPCIYLDKH